MADWQKIQTEYITSDTSYRKLADKYGIDQATIARKAKKEDWVSKRQQHLSEVQAKILSADMEGKVDRAERLMSVADKLLEKVEQWVAMGEPISANSIKNLSDALKNIKEVHMIRTAEDVEEQKVRIDKLRKEVDKEEGADNTIVIQFAAGTEDYAK